jgi:MarR family transcriptional regulator, organic hydroperoxide resistance regulator
MPTWMICHDLVSSGMADDQRDLGAMLQRVLTEVLARERVILATHDLPMWDYVALVRLDAGPAPTQAQLAVAMGRDKNRVIETVDRLEERGLISRQTDPADRRNHIVGLTPDGRRMLTASRREIRAMEQRLLRRLPVEHRTSFLGALRHLDDAVTGRNPIAVDVDGSAR